MTEQLTECKRVLLAAIQKAAQETPELATSFLDGVAEPSDCYEMMAGLTAEGDGSLLVFLAGRTFASKVLENIANPDEYEVCSLIQEAIALCISTRDGGGVLRCGNFYTLGHVETLLSAGIQIELETELA